MLARRVRLLIESADSGASAAPEVAAIMAPLLGWNRRRRAAEVREYQAFAATNAAALRPRPRCLSRGAPAARSPFPAVAGTLDRGQAEARAGQVISRRLFSVLALMSYVG